MLGQLDIEERALNLLGPQSGFSEEATAKLHLEELEELVDVESSGDWGGHGSGRIRDL